MNRAIIAVAFAVALGPRVVLAQATTSSAPADSTAVLVHQLVERSKAVDLALMSVEANVAIQRQTNTRVPAAFWDRFLSVARERRGELGAQIEGVYARHFSAAELRQLLAFYDTPVGTKLLTLQPTLAQESMVAGREWGQHIALEVAAQLSKDSAPAKP